MRSRFILPALLVLLLSACDSSDPLSVSVTDDLEPSYAEGTEPVIGAAVGGPAEIGSWGPVLDWPHVAVSMSVLPNGEVLTYSGSERRTWPTTEQTYSAVWDPDTGVFQENLHQGHNMFLSLIHI